MFGMEALVRYQPLDIRHAEEHSQGSERSSFLDRMNGLKHCVQFRELPSQRMQEESQSKKREGREESKKKKEVEE